VNVAAVIYYVLGRGGTNARQFVELLGVGGVYVYQERRLRFDFTFVEGGAIDGFGGALGSAGGVVSAADEQGDDKGAYYDLGLVTREEAGSKPPMIALPAFLRGFEVVCGHLGFPTDLRPVEPTGLEPVTSTLPAWRSPN
jgi:hypothetical protein